MIAGVEPIDCGYRVLGSLLLLLAMSEIILGLAGTLGDCRMAQFIHYIWEKPLLFMLVLVGHDERSFSLQISITKDITLIVHRVKDFSMISYYYCLLHFNGFVNINFNCKYPAANRMFGVGDRGAGTVCRVCSRLAVMYIYVYMCMCVYIYICM